MDFERPPYNSPAGEAAEMGEIGEAARLDVADRTMLTRCIRSQNRIRKPAGRPVKRTYYPSIRSVLIRSRGCVTRKAPISWSELNCGGYHNILKAAAETGAAKTDFSMA
jgi:hypothetical protein